MNDKINFESVLASLNIKEWVFYGSEPTTEAMFNSGFKKIVIVNGTHRESSDPSTFGVSWNEIVDEKNRLQAEWDSTEYQRLRAKEYPPVTDYLDAVVKGDLGQQQTYIDACLAVKAKYPKPEGV
jgi:hypothetical protein